MRILVVGGAGYIGSHMVRLAGHSQLDVTTLDNLSTGYRRAVTCGRLIEGDIADRGLLDEVLSAEPFDAVLHFASFLQVGESVREPAKYYANNVVNTLQLLDAVVAHRVPAFIFSSSAAVYGEPLRVPIDETHPTVPLSPYGQTKLIVEQALRDYDHAYGLKFVSLRYFNAAGADPDGGLGESHEPETHLIPLVLQAVSGRREAVTVFGTDYATADGTCVRDYIHVNDLCDAHLLAMRRLWEGGESAVLNLGNGAGFSVRQVLETAERVTGRFVPTRYGARRAGDPARLVADATRARAQLGWRPRYADLDSIVGHAWQWERHVVGI